MANLGLAANAKTWSLWERLADEDDKATRDAMRHVAEDLPDPAQYARYLPAEFVDALLNATFCDAWRVANTYAPDMARCGLVEVRGRYLTAFGMGVRRALREDLGA